ncbi:MAG: S8 family serine peptidase [Bacillota bacterium]
MPRNKSFTYLITALFFIFFIPFTVTAAEIPLDHWAAVDMLELNAQGIIQGETINPEGFVTRADFTKMIVTGAGLKLEALRLQGAPSPFHDVPNNHLLKGYIIAAKERGLVGGYSDVIFRPEEELRRDQMIVMLLRVMGLEEIPLDKQYLTFDDADDIPEYARPSINEGVRLGLVGGYADNTFRPEARVTVAEASAFINRWLDLKGDKYDYIGVLEQIDTDNKKMGIQVDNNSIEMPIGDDVLIISAGRPVSLSSLNSGDPLAVKLNVMGEAVLIQKKEIKLGNIPIYLEARKLPKLRPQGSGSNDVAVIPANLFNPRLPMDLDNITKSLETTKAEINLPSLMTSAGTDGRGKIVAVIDTGVDPSHPDLQMTTDGKNKIVDWVDFTLEGIVNAYQVPKTTAGTSLSWNSAEYTIGDIPSKSGIFKMGTINLNDIAPLELIDYSKEPVEAAILVADAAKAGEYDTVYVDANNDHSFADEKALMIYRKSHDYILLEFDKNELALVVVDIGEDGSYVQLASDISGHGTHVAGIIASNGKLRGIAPGAQLMVLKAVDRDGYAEPKNIIEAIRYAALHGANIINISLGQYQDIEPGQSELAKIVNEVVEKYGVVVVTAAGNTGPGINTVAAPADADSAISVGAFVSPRMWDADFGYDVGQDSLYYFSSIGPRRDGAWYPTITAPGSAVSTVPRWMNNPYMLTEGTSMAAPHVAGVAAHLLQAADKLGIRANPYFIKRAIEEGARDLRQFASIEDGHGVLDAYEALNKLKSLKGERRLSGTLFSPEYGSGPGVFAREYVPQRLMFNLTNTDNRDYLLEWTSTESWVRSELKTTHVMRGGKREIPIHFSIPEKPGLYSAVLRGDDPAVPGVEIEIPINIAVGEELHKQRPYTSVIMGSLEPAQLARYFVAVPDGSNYIRAELEIFPNTSGSYEGRGRVHLINPFGFEENMSDYAGLAPYALSRKNKTTATAYIPDPGTWEVVVYSSASLSAYNTDKTKYQLTMSLGDVVNINSITSPELDLVVSPIPESVLKKTKGTVILHIWDKGINQPFNGALEINGKFFEIENGRVEYDVNKIKENMRLRLTILK